MTQADATKPPDTARRAAAWSLLLLVHAGVAIGFLTGRASGTDAAWTGFPLDDAWIHLVYGRNLIEIGSLAYNATAEPGFTSPMWLIVVTLGALAGHAGIQATVITIKVAGVILGWLTSVGVMEVTARWGGGLRSGLVAGLMCALCPSLAFAQLSGMEVAMASAALIWALWYWQRDNFIAVGLLLGASVLTRPELGVIWVVFVLLALGHGESLGARLVSAVKVALPTGLGLGMWAIFCLSTTGHLLPNTFYAKFDATHPEGMWNIVEGVVMAMPFNTLTGAVVLYLVGAALMIASSKKMKKLEMGAWLGLPWLFFLAISLTRLIPIQIGLFFYWQRYVLPMLPWLFVPVGVGAGIFFGWLREGLPKEVDDGIQARPRAAVLVGVLLLVACVVDVPEQMVSRAKLFAWNCQNINEVQVAAGKWVEANVPEGGAVMVNDAGALRFFGQRHTVDLVGLNDSALLFTEGLREAMRVDPLAVRALMDQRGAKHLIVLPGWFQALTRHPDFGTHFEPITSFHSKNYTLGNKLQDTKTVFELKPAPE